MADPKETVYAADPHTKAKHQILQEYLTRWFTILSRQASNIGSRRRLLYFDGFAGAGEYEGSVPGSPFVAIETARSAAVSSVPIEIVLVEKRKDRANHLSKLVAEMNLARLDPNLVVHAPIEGDCEEEIHRLIDAEDSAHRSLGPAFFFLDQFGYSSFSMQLVNRILSHQVCEVFSYLNWNLLHPFMADPTKAAGISKAFGGSEWTEVVNLQGAEKEDRFREIYIAALRSRGEAKFVYPFAMRNEHDRVIYWLFFSTNNDRGLEEMKNAMWRVDRSGSFEFSDKFASSLGRLFKYEDADLAKDLHRTFAGKDLSVGDVRLFVLTETPAVKFKGALQILQREGKIQPLGAQARRGEFPDPSLMLRFVRDPVSNSLFGELG